MVSNIAQQKSIYFFLIASLINFKHVLDILNKIKKNNKFKTFLDYSVKKGDPEENCKLNLPLFISVIA